MTYIENDGKDKKSETAKTAKTANCQTQGKWQSLSFGAVKKAVTPYQYLLSKGYTPDKIEKGIYIFKNPLRADNAPSLACYEYNKAGEYAPHWYDFGTGKDGDVIDLCCGIENVTPSKALERLTTLAGTQTAQTLTTPAKTRDAFSEFSVCNRLNDTLASYITKKRGIPYYIWQNRVMQADYSLFKGCSHLFALAFENDELGYELRTTDDIAKSKRKRTYGKKTVTTVPGIDNTVCAVFEGFMDYLSFLTLTPDNRAACIVLNSVSNVNRAIPLLGRYDRILLYVDADRAGDKCTETIAAACGERVQDCREFLRKAGVKDVNEYLLNRNALTLF